MWSLSSLQLTGTVVRRPEDKALSRLLQHSAHPPPPPLHLVQLLPAHLGHLVGDQPPLSDHHVRVWGVSLYEDGAEDNTSEHGGSKVRALTLSLLVVTLVSLLQMPNMWFLYSLYILINFRSYVITSLAWWAVCWWMRRRGFSCERLSDDCGTQHIRHQYSRPRTATLNICYRSAFTILSHQARGARPDSNETTNLVSSEKAYKLRICSEWMTF